jgi:mRNA interferase MazF
VVPVTTSTDRVYPFQILLPARRCQLRRTSKAQAEQIRSISIDRVGEAAGRVPPDLMDDLDAAIRLHLAL